MTNPLFDRKRKNGLRKGIRNEFGDVKDKPVAPQDSSTSIRKDRVGSQTGIPAEVSSQDASFPTIAPNDMRQKDGTYLMKEPSNVQPGPNSVHWWRRNIESCTPQQPTIVLQVNIPQGKVFRVQRIGHTFTNANDIVWIVYDGKTWNGTKWSFQLGTPMTNLYECNPTFSATKSILCYIDNRGGVASNYEFFLSGWYDTIEYLRGTRTA